MGLLNWFQNDPEKQAALRQGLLSAGAAMMGNQNPSFLGAAGQGAMAGMQGYQDYFGNQQKQAYNKAMADAAIQNSITARMKAQAEAKKLEAKTAKEKQDRDEAVGFLKTYGFDVTPESISIDDEYGYSLNPGSEIKGGFMHIADSIPEETPILGNPFEATPQSQQPQQLVTPQQPKMQILNDQQNAALKRKQLQGAIGLNDDEFAVFGGMSPDQQAKIILKRFGSAKTLKDSIKPTGNVANFMYLKQNGMIPAGTDYTQWARDNARAGATNISNVLGAKDAAKSLAAPIGDRAEASLSLAEGATETMANANMVRNALNNGQVIAGPMAGVRLKWAQLKSVAGVGDTEELEQTRTTIQGLASLTLDSRAALKGQGQITEGETRLLERARSGNIDEMTIQELHTVVDISQRLAARQWERHNNLLSTMRNDPNAAASYQYYVPSVQIGKPLGRSNGAVKPQQKPPQQGWSIQKVE